MEFLKCQTFPQIKMGRYIKSKSNSRFFLLELIGRPTVVKAAVASLLTNHMLDFDDEDYGTQCLSRYNEDVFNITNTSSNNLTTATIVNKSINELFDISGKADKKFIEVLRSKISTPIADEWAEDIQNLLIDKGYLKAIKSNCGNFATLSNYDKSGIDEAINEYIKTKDYDLTLPKTEVPSSIGKFVEAYSKPLTDMIYRKCNVIYNGDEKDKIDYSLITTGTGFIPYPQQADVANAVVKRLETLPITFIAAEMGCGKTLMSLMALYGLYKKTGKGQRALLMLPPHLVEKWIREAKKALGTVLQSVTVISNKAEADTIRSLIGVKPKGIELYIVNREMAKLGYYWRPIKEKFIEEKTGKLIVECPKCGGEQVISKSSKSFCKNNVKNKVCGEPLWQAVESEGSVRQIQRVPIMEYLKKHLPGGFFDLFILDEAHEEKGESARGVSAAQAACVSKKALLLTGTLSGGKPSTLFYLLYRFYTKSVKDLVPYGDTIGFARRYGVVETVRKSDSGVDNSMSRSKKSNAVIKEKPGISPELLTKFLPTTAFMKIGDVAARLPEYTEYVTQVDLSKEHYQAYSSLEDEMFSAFSSAIRMGALGVIAKMLTILTAYADNPIYEEVTDKSGQVIAETEALEGVTAKEEELIRIVNEAKAQDRKVLVYCEFTDTRDIQQRLKDTLESYGLSATILPRNVKAVKREAWIEENTKEADVLICNPRLVATGLDLYRYPTIVFFQTPYSTYLLRQASRRSWRIGQTKSVQVHFLVNSGTVQEKAMLLIANKMTASQIFEGEIPEEDGLAALSDIEEKSFIMQLAGSLGNNEQVGSLDKLWKQKMQAEVKSDDLLFAPQVSDEEKETVKPITVKQRTETVIQSNRGGKEKLVFTKISSVVVYPDKAASFTLDNQMYLMKNGYIFKVSGKPNDKSKIYSGKYIWKDSKKTKGNKFAECNIKNIGIVYVGKKADTGEFVALKMTKASVAA